MATEHNRSTPSPAAAGDLALPALDLWQVPLFILAVLAIVGTWLVRPLWYDPDAWRVQRALSQARQLLSQPHASLQQVIALAEPLLERIDQFPHIAGETHFLLGSAYLRLATEGLAESRTQTWARARLHLEQAEALGVPEPDRLHLTYRLGQAWYQTGGELARVIDYLSRSVDLVQDDRAVGYSMLSQAYLRLPVPDLQAALSANEKDLGLPTDDEDLLAPARLLRGDLLFRLQQRAESRKVLSRIGASAPPTIHARARYLLARCYQEDRIWQEAARLWEEILADRRQTPRDVTLIYYYLGLCYRNLGQPAEAARIWESTLTGSGPESQATLLRLADLRLEEGQPKAALGLYTRALQGVSTPADYRNTLVDLPEARRLLETACRVSQERGDYDSGQQLAQLHARIALPAQAHVVVAQLAAGWAQAHRDPARLAALPEEGRLEQLAQVQAKFREAGAAYEAAAAAAPEAPDLPQWLRRSAESYLNGQDFERAIAVLDRFVLLPAPPEQLGEAWFRLAEAHQALQHMLAADVSYKKCIEFPSPFAYRARYHLAMTALERKDLEDAEEGLKQNLDLLRLTPERAMHEKTLYALAHVLYLRRNFQMAVLRFEDALEHYPANPAARAARFELGQCYRQLALEEGQNLQIGESLTAEARAHYRSQVRVWQEKAVAANQKLVDDLSAQEAMAPLAPADALLLEQALFVVAESQFDLGHYQEAIRQYDYLATRYEHQVEQLLALKGLWRCYCMVFQPDKARDALRRARLTLQGLSEAVFRDRPDFGTPLEWESWINLQEERLRGL